VHWCNAGDGALPLAWPGEMTTQRREQHEQQQQQQICGG